MFCMATIIKILELEAVSQVRPMCFPARKSCHKHTLILNQMYISLTFQWTCRVFLQWCNVFETSETQYRAFPLDHTLTV